MHELFRSIVKEVALRFSDDYELFREVAQRFSDDHDGDSDFIAEDREAEERAESPTIARPVVTNW